jgi:hypothetical protein
MVGIDAALHDEILEQVADLVVDETGNDGCTEAEAFGPSPGSSRSMISPRDTMS